MRMFFLLILLAIVGIYSAGRLTLNESGVNDLLTEMETLSLQGDVDGVCALFDDRVSVSLDDRTPGQPMKLTGGKSVLCAYLAQVLPLQQKMVKSSKIERDNFTIERDWTHPWTAHVSYTERRTVTVAPEVAQGSPQTHMQSRDQLTVVYKIGGRKITRIDSVSSALGGIRT